MKQFSVSMMCSKYLNLQAELEQLDDVVDGYHIDIMDGTYVPNFAMNFDLIQAIASVTTKPIDVHMMVQSPERYFATLGRLPIHGVIIHPETLEIPFHEAVATLKSLGLTVGVAIAPGVPKTTWQSTLDDVSKVTVMMVQPGFAGQSMVFSQLEVLEHLSSLENRSFVIELDGSTNETTANVYRTSGASAFILGSSLFRNQDLRHRFLELKSMFD
jgi:ribulose-phosphate 3-epimerase